LRAARFLFTTASTAISVSVFRNSVMKGLTAWNAWNIRELRISSKRSHLTPASTRSTAHRIAKDRNRDGGRCRREQKRAARKAFSSGPDINAGAEVYERKQREEIIQAYRMQGPRSGTDGAAIRLGISRTTLIYRMRRLGITRSCIPEKCLRCSRYHLVGALCRIVGFPWK